MLMGPEPLAATIDAVHAKHGAQSRVVMMSPQGRPLKHSDVMRLAATEGFVLIAGRYEGIDERLINSRVDEEISLGDFVLSGGEIAAMAVIDAVSRQLPGVLGHEMSAESESFAEGLLEGPQYTRPEVFEGQAVPEVLLSGDHEAIRRWRLRESLLRTYERRSDLLDEVELTLEQKEILADCVRERHKL
jgi:tRNA (guanine37-N1)-methyltransferase